MDIKIIILVYNNINLGKYKGGIVYGKKANSNINGKITTDKLKEAEIEIRKYQYSQDLNLVASYYYPIETLQQEDSNGKTSLNKLEEEYQKYLLSK